MKPAPGEGVGLMKRLYLKLFFHKCNSGQQEAIQRVSFIDSWGFTDKFNVFQR
jgi:hypothetical protein